jgi:hypothetical protein
MVAFQFGYAESLRGVHFREQNFRATLLRFETVNCVPNIVFDDVVVEDYANGVIAGEKFRQTERVRDSTLTFLVGAL